MTYEEIQSLINSNLADFSNIVPEKHREVEQALLNYIEDNLPLRKGSLFIGDIVGTDRIVTINFPNIGTSNYYVLGSLRSNSANFDSDNDVFWQFRETTATSFKLTLREVAGVSQNLTFFYEIKKI